MPETPSPVDVVLGWLAAVNAGDVARAMARTAADVAITGPNGTGRGRDMLRVWLEQAGATFEIHTVYAGGGAVVVAQRAVWRDLVSGAVRVDPEMVMRFRVVAGEIAEFHRYEELDVALRETGLDRERSRVVRNESNGV